VISVRMFPLTRRMPLRVARLDIETRKVPVMGGYRMANGEVLRNRWSVIAIGIAVGGKGVMIWSSCDDEVEILYEAAEWLLTVKEIQYYATRQFDEMVLKGRFTNARRAHAAEPFYPVMPKADILNWTQLPRLDYRAERPGDLLSKDVPAAWQRGEREKVLSHLKLDVVELSEMWEV